MTFTQLLALIFHFDQQISLWLPHLGSAIYLLLFFTIVLEIGVLPLFFLPGNPLIFIAGTLAAAGSMNIYLLMPLLLLATISASLLGYGLGQRLSARAYHQHYVWLNQKALRKAHDFYEDKGAYTFLLTPYLPVLRTFAPFVAGVAQMSFGKYLLSMTAGAFLWIAPLTLTGYFFGNVPLVREHMASAALLGIGIGVGGLLLVSLWSWRKKAKF